MQRFLPRHIVVSGPSMLPTLRHGQHVLVVPYLWRQPRLNDVVLAIDPRNARLLVKRITAIQKNNEHFLYAVSGDNLEHSTDSRDFGMISKKQLLGRLVYPSTKIPRY